MRDILGGMSISEAALWFVLIFLLPMIFIILRQLRRYENLYGLLDRKSPGKKAKKAQPESTEAVAGPAGPQANPDVFPYGARTFLDPSERSCLAALVEAIGEGAQVHAGVPLARLAESNDPNPGYEKRLGGLAIDFLVVEEKTGKPFTAVQFEPGKGTPRGAADAVKGVCEAIGLYLVFIPRSAEYSAKELKDRLGIPEIDV